jgi:glycosyltransferase involved in cell wall biosynthesis
MMAQQINVSIVTVTKDRPAFVGHLRHNIDSLDYDRELLEWVVVDDGRQPILDYVRDFPGLVYYYSKQHISLGKKRNLANSLTTGEVIFNFDDDNYAFSNRI